MQELLLVNPRARKSSGRKKPRTAAQRAATKRLVALNRSRHGGATKRRVKRRTMSATYAPNPIRRHKRRSHSVMSRVRHATRRYRRNPIHAATGNITGMLTQSFQGALGGIAVNTMLNYVPLPATMKTGNMQYVTRGVAAILLGVVGSKVMPSRIANNMAVGSLTITLHDAIKDIASTMLPGMQLGGVGYYTGGYPVQAVPAQLSAPARSAGRSMAGVGVYSQDSVGMAL